MTTQKLTASRVNEIMSRVLFKDDEDMDEMVRVSGIMNDFGFHPQRLAEARGDIAEMLAELPDDFHASKGGGMSFLSACMDRHGHHWAEHPTIDRLFCLGMGVGMAKYLMPREMWSAFPGGMPYAAVDVTPAKQPA